MLILEGGHIAHLNILEKKSDQYRKDTCIFRHLAFIACGILNMRYAKTSSKIDLHSASSRNRTTRFNLGQFAFNRWHLVLDVFISGL